MADSIQAALERWQNAGAELIEATIELGIKLFEARCQHQSDQEFSNWLDKNGFKEKINHNDRAGFIRIGKNPEIARAVMLETEKRNPMRVGQEVESRFNMSIKPESAASENNQESTTPPAATSGRPLCTKCHQRPAHVTHVWCAQCRNKPRKGKGEKGSRSSKKKSSKRQYSMENRDAARQAKQGVFAAQLLVDLRRKRKEANDVKINSKWRPEAISIIDLHEIISWIENELEAFVKNMSSRDETDIPAQGGQNVYDIKDRIAAINS